MERRETAILAALGVPDPYAPAESLPPGGKARSAKGALPSAARPRGA
jgi:hypothetical protein